MTVKSTFYSQLLSIKNNTLFSKYLQDSKKSDENPLPTAERICGSCSIPDIGTLFKSVISLFNLKPYVNHENTEPRHRL